MKKREEDYRDMKGGSGFLWILWKIFAFFRYRAGSGNSYRAVRIRNLSVGSLRR